MWFSLIICVPLHTVQCVCVYMCVCLVYVYKMNYRQDLCPWQFFPLVIPNDLLSSVHTWIKLFPLSMFDLQLVPVCCADVCALLYLLLSFYFCVCVHTHVFVCVSRDTFTLKRDVRRKKKQKKNNQSGSSLGPVTKVIQRFYQWAKVPVAMETLMNEKRPSNRGDGVNEELPHRPDTVCDGGCFLETEIFIHCHHIAVVIIVCYYHHLHNYYYFLFLYS